MVAIRWGIFLVSPISGFILHTENPICKPFSPTVEAVNLFHRFSTRHALTSLPQFDMSEGEWYEKNRQKWWES